MTQQLPKFVTAEVLRGSILFSHKGRPKRLRAGEPAAAMPREIYMRFKPILRLVHGGGIPNVVTTDMKRGEAETRQPEAPFDGGEVPEWTVRLPPKEYLEKYGQGRRSPSVAKRVALARHLVAKAAEKI
jgi:hypothetical protein